MAASSSSDEFVLPIAPGAPEMSRAHRSQIGGKGFVLAELARLGAPVPPGFILPIGFRAAAGDGGDQTREVLERELARLGELSGKRFGDPHDPLLVSLRASVDNDGARDNMPLVLNLGLTPEGVAGLAGRTGDPRLAWDGYLRFLHTYGLHVLRVAPEPFDERMREALERERVDSDAQLRTEALESLTRAFREICDASEHGVVPDDPWEQLLRAIEAGYAHWGAEPAGNGAGPPRAALPVSLVVQQMVHGTGEGISGAGTFFTRHPVTGERALFGKWLGQANGTDLTAGTRFPEELSRLERDAPDAVAALREWGEKIERHFHDAYELQFTLDKGALAILRARPAGRRHTASLTIALTLHAEGAADERQALRLVDPAAIDYLLHPMLDKEGAGPPVTKGLPASPGSAVGRVVFFAEQVEELAAQGVDTILVRHETTPEDIGGLSAAKGILTAHGGLTSHAAVVARGMGKCCVVGAGAMEINYHINEMQIGNTTIKRMDWISLDGSTGEVFLGQVPQVQPTLEGDLAKIMTWADAHRTMGVRANADTEEDARRALEMGAEGIGLCRTEHMFFHIERIPTFRKMILAVNEEGRTAALAELLPLQRKDFMDLFRVMEGRPVTIRLLDPPLNEFLPRGIRSQTRMSKAMGVPVEEVQRRIEALSENNPMLGHRGCRLAFTYPEIYQMQVRAIVEAACIVVKEGNQVDAEIMVPLVSTAEELRLLREDITTLATRVMEELGERLPIKVGTMVETPRAAVCSAEIAPHADFYSFGTNDLTQMGYGFSRDDAGTFLPRYLEDGVLATDPFIALDQDGIGALVRIAIEEGRRVRPDLKVGICGEHGGEPSSVKFFHRTGLDYVSCSPFRLPIARLAAAQAAVEAEED